MCVMALSFVSQGLVLGRQMVFGSSLISLFLVEAISYHGEKTGQTMQQDGLSYAFVKQQRQQSVTSH